MKSCPPARIHKPLLPARKSAFTIIGTLRPTHFRYMDTSSRTREPTNGAISFAESRLPSPGLAFRADVRVGRFASVALGSDADRACCERGRQPAAEQFRLPSRTTAADCDRAGHGWRFPRGTETSRLR